MKLRELNKNEIYCIVRADGYEDFEVVGVYTTRELVSEDFKKLATETGYTKDWIDTEDKFATSDSEKYISIQITPIK